MLTENICCNCHWYQGVKAVAGSAPCSKRNKQVLWNEDCDEIWLIPERLKIEKKKTDSIPMNEVRINLNEFIKVKLTDLGKDIYYHQFDELNQQWGRIVCKPSFPKEDAEGYTKFQLWNFIEIYGEHFGMTKPNVIEPLDIIYEPPKE